MAFTHEQLQKRIGFSSEMKRLLEPNYSIITDYLTGSIAALPALQPNHYNEHFHELAPLLNQRKDWNANDEMLMTVFNDPAIAINGYYRLISSLPGKRFNVNEAEGAEDMLFILNKLTMTDEQRFYRLENFYYAYRDKPDVNNAVFRFFKNFIQKLSQDDIDYLIRNRVRYDSFDRLFFWLLTSFRPEKADDYALKLLVTRENRLGAAVFANLLAVNRVKYQPAIYTIQQHKDKVPADNFLNATIALDKGAPSALHHLLMLEACNKYLDYFENRQYQGRFYESGIAFIFAGEENPGHITYSGYALYQLLQNNRGEGLRRANELIEKTRYMNVPALKMLAQELKEETIPFILRSLQAETSEAGNDYHPALLQLLRSYDKTLYLDQLWLTTSNKSKPAREAIGRELSELDPGIIAKATALLAHKKGEQRQLGTYILSHLNLPEAISVLQKAADTETNDDARDVMLHSMLPETFAYKRYEDIVPVMEKAAARGKLKKSPVPWLNPEELPAVYLSDGTTADTWLIYFLLYRMSRVKEMRSDMEVRHIFPFIDREKSSPFAKKIIQLFFDNGAEVKYKYVLALGALIGNDEVVDKLRTSVVNFVENARIKMAEFTVGALALQGSDKALRWVEFFSRKYRSKKANVGAAALQALEAASEELGITMHELGDRVVPDFGFDGLFKHFIIDGEEYRAFIDSNFRLAFFNEDNKKLKSLPAAAGSELKEEFKAIGKEVRDIVRSQSSRLEYYLIIQRRWSYAQWQKFFLQNPVMFIYATKLLWGAYDHTGQLKQTFICSEDGSLLDTAQEEITPDTSLMIGMVHPSQLDKDTLQQWKQLFFDWSVDPIFPQLERKIPGLNDIDMSKAIITKFEGKQMATGSIKNTLERYGWHKGPTGDGGYIQSFNLLYFEKQMEAVLELEGVGVGYGWGTTEKLGRLYVLDHTKNKQRWFAGPSHDQDDRLVRLENIPPIFFTEMLAAVEAIKPAENSG
jgi:hypothetical protein